MRRIALIALCAGLSGCGSTKLRSVQPRQATSILVHKAERRLRLMDGDSELKAFDIALGRNPVGPKVQEWDGKTPEGAYYTTYRNSQSRYHLSIGVSYPSTEDVARAHAMGVSPGSDIYIHGQPQGIGGRARIQGDWTAGCIAVSNADMEQIFAMVQGGIPIFIHA